LCWAKWLHLKRTENDEVKKTTLKISTPHGEFTRTTGTAYTHAVVAIAASRCGTTFATPADVVAYCDNSKSGVMARVLKDRGYIVSWHSSAAAAQKAAIKGNSAYFTTHTGEVFKL